MTSHYLWILSQFGILLEAIGAMYIAVSAIAIHDPATFSKICDQARSAIGA